MFMSITMLASCSTSSSLGPTWVPCTSARVRAHIVVPRSMYRQAGPNTPEPDYKEIDSQPLNRVIMSLFRRKMVLAIGEDVPSKGYQGIIDLTRKLNTKFGTARETQVRTVGILVSLFPSWLLPAFKVLFAKPMPTLSCKMNALATALTCEWLMGPMKINDVEIDGGQMGVQHGIKVERCRYLEEAGCASVCVNSCKVPTQEFFEKHMGLPLTMTPNYDDFSCQFAFGKTPGSQATDEAFASPCFSQCPTKRAAAAAGTGAGQGSSPSTSTLARCHKVEIFSDA